MITRTKRLLLLSLLFFYDFFFGPVRSGGIKKIVIANAFLCTIIEGLIMYELID